MAKKAVKIKVEAEPEEDILPEGIENEPIPKSSCALWSVFLLLFIILLVLIGLLFYLKTKDLSFLKSKTNTNANVNTTIQLASSVGEEVTLKITEEQLQSAIKADDNNFPIKKATVKINTDKIILSGKTSNNFWGLNVEVSLVPKVENGKVKFDITEIKSAGMKAPNSISDVVNNNLGQYLDGLSSTMGDVEVTEVKLEEGYITVVGRQKS